MIEHVLVEIFVEIVDVEVELELELLVLVELVDVEVEHIDFLQLRSANVNGQPQQEKLALSCCTRAQARDGPTPHNAYKLACCK